jgi:hypothetical protein
MMAGSVLLKYSLLPYLSLVSPKGDGKIREILEKQKCCSDIAEGKVEAV